MTFSRKIFIAVFVSTLVVGAILLIGTHYFVRNQVKSDFISRYLVFSDVLSETLNQLDKKIESQMYNAARYVADKDIGSTPISNDYLKIFRDDLNMTHIFLINNTGEFVRSTNEDPSLIPNVFSFCPKYKGLVTGESNVEATPIIHPDPEPRPYKFLLLANEKAKRIVEVGVRVDFIADTLVKALKSDSNVMGLSLYTPHGVSFGEFSANKVDFDEEGVSLPETYPSMVEHKNHYDFYAKVISSHPKCCQCDVSGTSKNGEYYYVLRAKVSKDEIASILKTANVAFGLFGFVCLILAYFLGRVLSRRLVRNIERAVVRVKEIKDTGDISKRVNIEGSDEVSYLTKEFDRTLDTLEKTQSKIVEAEKVEAKVKLAREVAHNIRSPIVAVEMVLPTMAGVSDKVKNVLKSSIKEIKDLSQRLTKEADELSGDNVNSDLVYLPTLIEEIVNQKGFEYSKNPNIEITYENKGDSRVQFVRANPTELKSVISNLVNNAAEAMTAKPGRIELYSICENGACTIEVCDTGVGIPQEYIQKLGHEPITFKGSGTRGTGLVHAFDVIKSYGGDIKIDSKVDEGTVIKISLPDSNTRSSFDLEG